MLEFTSRYPILISLILLAASFISSFYFYRKTNLNRIKKYILIIIKTAAVFIILFLFIEPSILALVNTDRSPVNIVLIDDSRSNHLPYKDKLKMVQIKDMYNQLNILKTYHNKFSFSGPTSPPKEIGNIDSLYFDGFETNLLTALENIREIFPEDIYNSLTIISDGVFNSGGSPLYTAKTFQCPFITISIGDTAQQKDIVISNVLYNERAFTEAVNKISSEINAYGFINESISINLIREGAVVAVKNAEINTKNWRSEITFDNRESEPGTIRYRITVESKPSEITYKNNHSDFLIKYLQNKINILFISDGPGYDNALISNILKRIKNYNVTIKTVKSNNDFYEGPIDFKSFSDLSAVFLLGFPIPQFNSEIVSSLAEKVKALNIPLIFFSSKNTDYKKLEIFDELIPFTINKPMSGEETISIQGTDKAGTMYENIFKEISSAPPIYQNLGVTQKAGSEVILISRTSGEPVLITRSTPKTKSTAFLGYGFWKWRLNPKLNYESLLEKFLLEIINMSLIKDKKSKLTVIPDKNIFDYSEDAKFTAEVYDENFNPIKNASVKAKILFGNSMVRNDLIFTSMNNRYYLNTDKLQAGDYKIEAEAELNGNFYAKDEERFVIDTLNTEFKITKSNFENLKLLSDNTGGKFFTGYSSNDTINNYINSIMNNKERTQTSRYVHINLWENKYILLTAILLFAIEWFLRKRNNLP